jgi:hypothetical protein
MYCQTFPQRLAIDYWHLGRALNYAKEKCPQGKWTEWQAQYVRLGKDTINRAMRLAEAVTDPKQLNGKRWLAALSDLGILAPQTRQTIKGNSQPPEDETQGSSDEETPQRETPNAEVPEPQPTAGVHRRQGKAQGKPPSTILDAVRSALEKAANLIDDYGKQARVEQAVAREHVDMAALGEAMQNALKALDWLNKELKTNARGKVA